MTALIVAVLLLGQSRGDPPSPSSPAAAEIAARAAPPRTPPKPQRFELALTPASLQVSALAQHVGTTASLHFQAHERFALTVSGGYLSWFTARAQASELEGKLRVTPAADLRPTWSALAGVEVAVGQGALSVGGTEAELRLVISGAAGMQATQLRITQFNWRAVSFVGDASPSFAAQVGLGLRVRLGAHFALRLDVRDLIVPGVSPDRVNGCTPSDVVAMERQSGAGNAVAAATVSAACARDSYRTLLEGSGAEPVPRSIGTRAVTQVFQRPELSHGVTVALGAAILF